MKRKISIIRKKKKIRVAFLVSESSKWGYQSIYDKLSADKRFDVFILTTKLFVEHFGLEHRYQTMAECQNFFRNKGMKVISAYDEQNKEYISPAAFDVDILFYQQPYDLAANQHPMAVSKHAITCYAPYGLYMMENSASYMEYFHRFLDYYFIPGNGDLHSMAINAKNVTNCKSVGYAKLDKYAELNITTPKKPIIIYAPHHSFEPSGLNLATFQYNATEILELAKQFSDKFDWVFKPHPRLKHAAVINNIMTADQIDKYYADWAKIGNICQDGDYFEIFQQSSALITDCSSFLGEYLPSGHPILHLINKQARFNQFARSFINTYYKIYNLKDMKTIFERVVIQNDDFKANQRRLKIPLLFDPQEHVSAKIYKILINKIGI